MTEIIDPIAVAGSVTSTLDRLGITNTIGGSIASSFAGEPRSTIDLDIVAAIEDRHISSLVEALSPMLKVHLFVAGGTPLDSQQLARRQAVIVRPGVTLYVHPPEDILLQSSRIGWAETRRTASGAT